MLAQHSHSMSRALIHALLLPPRQRATTTTRPALLVKSAVASTATPLASVPAAGGRRRRPAGRQIDHTEVPKCIVHRVKPITRQLGARNQTLQDKRIARVSPAPHTTAEPPTPCFGHRNLSLVGSALAIWRPQVTMERATWLWTQACGSARQSTSRARVAARHRTQGMYWHANGTRTIPGSSACGTPPTRLGALGARLRRQQRLTCGGVQALERDNT